MSENIWYDGLLKKYPIVFKNISYIECSKGWSQLINSLAKVLEEYISSSISSELQQEIYAIQVKQKFGGLRFYMSQEDAYITGAIILAENLSNHICEECGNVGIRKNVGGWITTLCEDDFKKYLIDIKKF